MGPLTGWRWWLRRDCRAIASTSSTTTPDGHTQELRVTLCRRWRWHAGPCRSEQPTPTEVRP